MIDHKYEAPRIPQALFHFSKGSASAQDHTSLSGMLSDAIGLNQLACFIYSISKSIFELALHDTSRLLPTYAIFGRVAWTEIDWPTVNDISNIDYPKSGEHHSTG